MSRKVKRSVRGAHGAGDGAPVSLAASAYRAIRDKLVMLELRPGAPINDEQLARDLGMGRTPVREALKRLETERLVVTYPRRGTFATEVNITDLAHIFEVRQHLEPAAAASAATHATAADRKVLEELLHELDADHALDEPPEPLMGLDMRVHRGIYAATHNPYFEDTLILYDNLATRIWCLFLARLPDLAGHVGDHSPLLLAVIDGDAEKAADLSRDHVVRFEQAIRAVI